MMKALTVVPGYLSRKLRTLERHLKTQNPRIGDIKVETLVDASIVKKLDDSGFFDKLYAEYGVK